jgi:CHAT domain-containing protein
MEIVKNMSVRNIAEYDLSLREKQNYSMQSKFLFFQKFVILIILIQVGVLSIFGQQAPTDYSFLVNLDKDNLKKWIQSKSKSDLTIAIDSLVTKSDSPQYKKYLFNSERLLLTSLTIAESCDDSYSLGRIYYLLGIAANDSTDEKINKTASNYFTKAQEVLVLVDEKNAKILLGKTFLELAEITIKSPTINDYSGALLKINLANRLALETKSNQLMGLTYKSFGLYFFYQEQYTSSLCFFERANDLLDLAVNNDALLELYTHAIYLFTNLNIRDQSLKYNQIANSLLEKSFSKRREIAYLRARANVYNSNGDSVEAIKIYRQLQKTASDAGDFRKSISFQFAIGKTYQWEGNNLNAESEFRQVIAAAEKLFFKEEELIRRSKIGLAASLAGQRKYIESLQIYKKLIENLGNDRTTQYDYYLNFAIFMLSQDDYLIAKNYLDLASKVTKNSDSLSYINSLRLWLDYKTKTISPAETIEILNQSISQIKDEQLNTRNIGINLNYLDEFIFPFRFKTLVQIEKGDFEDALLDSDSYKSRWLTSKMVSDKNFGVVNKSWIASEEAIEIRDRIFQRLLISGLKDEEKSDIELQTLLKTHDEKLNMRQDVSSLTEKFKKTEISQIELKDLTSKLSGSVILEYSFTNEFLTVFIIRQNEPIKAFKINISERLLKEKIEKWRAAIVGQDLGFKKGSHELYDLLIKPVEAEIKNSAGLVIIPEGILWKLPFQALLNSQQKYLIEQTPISYVPSLKALQTIQNKDFAKTDSALSFAGFGNPSDNSTKALPEAETEIKNLMAVYPTGSFLFREKATETSLKDSIDNVDILHLAVHGKLDESQPMRSAMILTKDSKNDGNFEIEEIIGLKKSPKLVVLSACSTSDGQVFNGEGLLSLTWAFIAAGSRNVVATQWEIDDVAASEQMLSFHQSLSKNVSVAKSLQFAVLEQIKKKGIRNHPYYWAGFVSVGGF